MSARVFLDTNVFLYAIGAAGPHRKDCRALLALLGGGELRVVTSSEVLQEILHVLRRRRGLADAVVAVRAAAAMVDEVLPIRAAEVLSACAVMEGVKSPFQDAIDARDAVHVAAMRAAGIRTIVSVDRDFDKIEGLRRIAPGEAVADLVS